jgi:hypothetical protein
VRVERWQAISYADARAEGIRAYDEVAEYRDLWNELNAKRGYSWQTNPWVWALSFSVLNVRPAAHD